MPSIANVVARFAKQTLVYWPKIGDDGYGRPIFGTPYEIKCRWEDKQKLIITTDHRTIMSSAHLLLVNPVDVGGIVLLGTLATWKAMPTYDAIPTFAQGAREVMLVNANPDIKAQSIVYEAYL